MELLLLFLGLFVFLLIKGFVDRNKAKARLIEKLMKSWGAVPEHEYSEEKYRSREYYYEHQYKNAREGEEFLDEITWHDLNMDYMFSLLDANCSAMGEEYLWAILHHLQRRPEQLEEREHIIRYFEENPEVRIKIQTALSMIGRNRKTSVYEFMAQMDNVKRESNLKHYLMLLVMAGGAIITPFHGAVGGGILIVSAVVNIILYFVRKGETSLYFTAMSYVIRMLHHAKELSELKEEGLAGYAEKLHSHIKSLQSLQKGASVVAAQSVSGDMMQLFLDYFRMLFHTDLIKFNRMLDSYFTNKNIIIEVFETIGFLDAMCAIASFRNMVPYYTTPEFTSGKRILAEKLYHPFLEKPVPASIDTEASVLVTGSNASGKSTFLKACALNTILAQTVHTVCAKSYRASYFRVMSSMALADDLLGGESYYIVEIRSLKRILSAITEKDTPVLCFVDEVLRGTNTVERIAASARILYSIAKQNALMFAATHDIELTYMLEDVFRNYHFEEQIHENEICFDYQLREGRATSQNAIRLLALLGYPEEIILSAGETATIFLETGEWRKITE
ncbi:MAG: hypothetical protein E7260_01285 [Lachnospiraceae bacterium]|nr:hypothetical protein [Lachnospiraceae bacterium]